MGNTGSRQSAAPTTTQITLFDGKVVTARIGTQIVEEPRPTMDSTDGISISGAEGCNKCVLTLPMGVSAASVQLFREYGDVTEEECKRLVKDITAVQMREMALIEFKNKLVEGKYFLNNGNGFCSQIIGNKDEVNKAKTIGEIDTAVKNADIIKVRKMSEGGGYSSSTKLFITPSIPFKFSFVGGSRQVTSQFEIKRITVYRPCPIRIENVQYDAVLSLNDISDKTNNPKTIILVPIQVKPTPDSDSERFVGRIASYIPGILMPNPATNQFDTINVPTGNDWDISKLLKPNPDGSVKNGFFVWTGTPELEKYSSITYSAGVATDIRYKWRSASNSNAPTYILMKNPITVGSITMQNIQMLPVTPSKEAIQFPLPGTLTYKPGPPGSDVVGCEKPKTTVTTTKEGFEGAAKCDPFNNFPNSASAEDKRIESQQMFWSVVGWVGTSLAVIFTIWLAVKFVQSPYGKALFGKLGEKLADAFAKVKNVPSMFKTEGGPPSGPDLPTLQLNPMRQPGAKAQQATQKASPQQRSTLRNFFSSSQNKTRKLSEKDKERTRAKIEKLKEDKKRFQEEQAAKAEAERKAKEQAAAAEEMLAAEARQKAREIKEQKTLEQKRAKIDQLPKLPTDDELDNDKRLIKKRKEVEDLHKKMGMAKLSYDAAKKINAPNTGEKQQLYKNTKAKYIEAEYQFGEMVEKHKKLMAEILAAKKSHEEFKEAKENHEKKYKNVLDNIKQVRRLKKQNAPQQTVTSAVSSLTQSQKQLQEAQKEVNELAEVLEEKQKLFEKKKTEFSQDLVGKLFVNQAKSAAQEAKEAADQATEMLEKDKKAQEEATSAGTGLLSTATPPKPITKAPPLAQTKKREGKRNIAVEEPDEDIEKGISDMETDIKDLQKRIKRTRVDFKKSGKSVPIVKLGELRKLENQAIDVQKELAKIIAEEDKEKAARELAAARAKLRFTNQTLMNNFGRPSIPTGRGRRKGRKQTRRY